MTWIKKKIYFVVIPISLSLFIASAISVEANSPRRFVDRQKVQTLMSQKFIPQNLVTPPAISEDRTRCSPKQGLIALMPKKKLGLTFNERPTFFWHKSDKNVQTAEFSLVDDNDDLVYETNFKFPKKTGIFAFTLPPEAPSLKVNKRYHWLVLPLLGDCGSENIDNFATVEGWIERIKPNLIVQMKLNKFEPKYHSIIYAEAGIWHEAITHVAQQRCTNPNDSNVMLYWNQLLTSVGLSHIVSEPMNNSCTV